MAFKFGAASSKVWPTVEIAPVTLQETRATAELLATQARINEVAMAAQDGLLDQRIAPETVPNEVMTDEGLKAAVKLSKLVADDFPFDESQLEAIAGIANQRFACLTGAAGTGKTTSTKAIVDRIQDTLGVVNMTEYFKKWTDADREKALRENPDATEDDYKIPERPIPSICLCGFTGRSTQMIKKNFPKDWHGNIMTIHRMLAFAPEFYEDYDPEFGGIRNRMRFSPGYDRFVKLPWDVIIIDEAGMVSVELWNQIWDAAKEGTRVIMIGDINQLPPVHGRSIFGFAMTKWPSWELTHIHRQEGKNNSIVDNAWKILKGQRPVSDEYQSDPGWKFAMMPIPEDSALASQKIRKWLATMNGKAYQPNRDSVITAINGEDSSRGYALGQLPMNRELAIVFNKDSARYVIDAGRDRKQFAVGDKVMATRNDHEAGVTNGMTGLITKIERNGAYAGDTNRFGEVGAVGRYLADIDESDEEEFSLDDISDSYAAVNEGIKAGKESKDRGPASHIVTVDFGGDIKEIPFATLSEVGTLMTAYVVTCHKMQGGESPLVVIILHQSHKAMLNREWLYTAVTRASQKCVLFFTDLGLRAALNKQRITGKNLAEKVQMFNALQTSGIAGAAINVNVPTPESLGTDLAVAAPRNVMEERVEIKPEADRVNPFAKVVMRSRVVEVVAEVHHFHHTVAPPTPPKTVDMGAIQARRERDREQAAKQLEKHFAIPHKPRHVIPVGPVVTLEQAGRPQMLRLTHQPVPQVTKFRFGQKG